MPRAGARLQLADHPTPEAPMPTKPIQVVFDSWDTYAAESPDGPIFVSFDVEAAERDLSDTLTHSARVIIPIHRPNDNGGAGAPGGGPPSEVGDGLTPPPAAARGGGPPGRRPPPARGPR